MFKFTPRFYLKCLQRVNDISGKRYFLSPAYKCSESWKNRLQNKVFQNIDIENMYYQLDLKLKSKCRMSFLDIDLFLNSVQEATYKNEVEDILVRFRLCPECVILPERATHAAIRWYMDHTPKEDLLNALSDRLNYGLFPDYYLSNLLMNNFITQKDYVSAVKIAVLEMLQEDFGNSLNKALALHSCFAYLDCADVWESPKPPVPEEDDEVQKVRVPFIRNPYFDDHFDLTNTNYLVGKTIWMLGTKLEGSLGTSCQLIGLVLYEKYEDAHKLLQELLKNKKEIHSDAIERVSNYLEKTPKQSASEGGDESKAEEPAKPNEFKLKISQLLKEIKPNSSTKSSLSEEIKQFVEKAVKEFEPGDIANQTSLYKQWEEDRKADIEVELEREKKENLKVKIESMKKELELEEEKLFYFDKEEEIQLKLEEVEEKKKSVKYWRGSKQKKAVVQEEYIPPDVHQRQG